MGDLTIITVNAPQGGRGKNKLDDPLVKRLRSIYGVEAVTPKQRLEADSITLITGTGQRYIADWTTVVGLDTGEVEKMGLQAAGGRRTRQERRGDRGPVPGLQFPGQAPPRGPQHGGPVERQLGRERQHDRRAAPPTLTP